MIKPALAVSGLAIFLTGCTALADFGITSRETLADVSVGKTWCALEDAEQAIVAARREYSPEFVTWMNSRCE